MILLLTGTPGTGKTTVSKILSHKLGYKLISINDWVTNEAKEAIVGYDSESQSNVIDVEIAEKKLKEVTGDAIIEGHLSHLMNIGDLVVVLRAHPKVLSKRLSTFSESKRKENIEAEALDVCLIESLERYGKDKVFEVDTTDKKPAEIAANIKEILEGHGSNYKPGNIDWSEELRPDVQNK